MSRPRPRLRSLSPRLPDARYRGGLAWFVAVLVVAIQVLYGAHTLTHLDNQTQETCEVCVSAGNLSAALPSLPMAGLPRIAAVHLHPAPLLLPAYRVIRFPHQRGPPSEAPTLR
jgi:hypothetical protein